MSRKQSSAAMFQNRQFAYWLLVAVPAFVITVQVLKAVDAPTLWSVTAGMALSSGLDPVMHWFIDWKTAEDEVNEHALE